MLVTQLGLTLVSGGEPQVTEQEVSPQLRHGGHPLQLKQKMKLTHLRGWACGLWYRLLVQRSWETTGDYWRLLEITGDYWSIVEFGGTTVSWFMSDITRCLHISSGPNVLIKFQTKANCSGLKPHLPKSHQSSINHTVHYILLWTVSRVSTSGSLVAGLLSSKSSLSSMPLPSDSAPDGIKHNRGKAQVRFLHFRATI